MEVVCKNCGTINNDKNNLCIRCGSDLNSNNIEKFEKIIGKVTSEKVLSIFYVIILIAYLYSLIFYVCPWLNDYIFSFKNSYVFEFYGNITLTEIILNTIYVICLYCMNQFVFSFFLLIITDKRIIKREKVSLFCLIVNICLIIGTGVITFLKNDLNYLLIIEHLMSVIIVLPYIKRKMTKKSI